MHLILCLIALTLAFPAPPPATGLLEKFHPRVPKFLKSLKPFTSASNSIPSDGIQIARMVTRQDHIDKSKEILSKAKLLESTLATKYQPRLDTLANERISLLKLRKSAKRKYADKQIQYMIATNLYDREKLLMNMDAVKNEVRVLKKKADGLVLAAEAMP
jgi:hypothetical protein